MAEQSDKKFTWVIKNFFPLQHEVHKSDTFEIGGCTCICYLSSVPLGKHDILFLTLGVDYGPSLPSRWRRYIKYRLTIVNQLSEELSAMEEGLHWLDSRALAWNSVSVFPLPKLHDRDNGFLVNGELKIVAEVSILEVTGKLDVPKESEETSKPLSKVEKKDGVKSYNTLKEASSVMESEDVNGFQILPSKVEYVRRIFEKHPDISVEFRAKSNLLRKACMNILLSIIEMLCQSLEELSSEDLVEADIALTYVKDAGFKVDWLEKKLCQVKEKKEREQSSLDRLQKIEEFLLKLKEQRLELDVLAEEEKAELLDTRTPLSFDDVV